VNSKEDLYFNAVIWVLMGVAMIVLSQRRDRYPQSTITLENPLPEAKPKRERRPLLVFGIVQILLGVWDFCRVWVR